MLIKIRTEKGQETPFSSSSSSSSSLLSCPFSVSVSLLYVESIFQRLKQNVKLATMWLLLTMASHRERLQRSSSAGWNDRNERIAPNKVLVWKRRNVQTFSISTGRNTAMDRKVISPVQIRHPFHPSADESVTWVGYCHWLQKIWRLIGTPTS